MQILLNGEPQELASDSTIRTLLENSGLLGQRLAVELNQEIVPKSEHATTYLKAGDRVEIVHAIGGG